MKVEIYSDVVCPWCYIGEHRFRRALAAYPGADRVDVVYRSFQLDPDAPAEATPLRTRLRERFGESVDAMLERVDEHAAAEGLAFAWDRAQAVNTLTAHRLLRLAEIEYGDDVQRALVEKLFEAYFVEGGDVSDHGLLTDLAASVGIDRDRAARYLAAGEGLDETRYAIDQARRMGVRSVPTFVFEGQWAVQGAQPASAFLQVLEEVEARSAGAGDGSATENDDACADGRCAV